MLAQADMDVRIRVAVASERKATIYPIYEYVGTYYKWMKHLLETGKMHPDYIPVRDRID